MTSVPGPYGASPPPQRPIKYRPSAGWFVAGIVLIVLAVALGIGLFVWTLSSFLDTQARIDADGQPRQVTVAAAEEMMLWGDEDSMQTCTVVDTETGTQVERRDPDADFSRSDSDGDFEGLWTFDSGSGDLEVTCSGGGLVLLGEAPAFGSFVLGIIATIAVPGLLGLAGLVVLIWTGILWSLRPARPRAG